MTVREPFVVRNFTVVVLASLAVIIVVLYSPALGANFMGDDFNWLRFLHFNFSSLLEGQNWNLWLTPFMSPGKWILFRPALNLFFLLDYTGWQLNPIAYHITDLILHIANSFLIFLFALQLTKRRWESAACGILFAIMPVHVEAVAWFSARADSMCTLWFLLSCIFFALFRKSARSLWLVVSIGVFAMALATKEIAVTLPLVVVAYDWLYHRDKFRQVRQMLIAHGPFWMLLSAYLILRVALLGEIQSYAQAQVLNLDWVGFYRLYLSLLSDPFLPDLVDGIFLLLLIAAATLLFVYRSDPAVPFGMFWLFVTILPSFFSIDRILYDRFVYLPSVGLVLVFVEVCTRIPTRRYIFRLAGWLILFILGIGYASALYVRSDTYARDTVITKLVPDQVRGLRPVLPDNPRLIFTGFPIVVVPRGVQAFGWVVDRAMQIAYDSPRIQAVSVDRFPLLVENLDRIFFFEYNRRRVTERMDLIRALQERNHCADFDKPTVVWDFSIDVQGWDAWNDISDFQNRDGMLAMRASGNDPYLASPEIAIPTMEVGDIEIAMLVRAEQSTFNAQLYWLAIDQPDFSPDLNVSFSGKADGALHIYRVNLAKTERLWIADKIVRLRIDPTDAPADIGIKSITVYTHCDPLQNQQCSCGR